MSRVCGRSLPRRYYFSCRCRGKFTTNSSLSLWETLPLAYYIVCVTLAPPNQLIIEQSVVTNILFLTDAATYTYKRRC